MDNDTQETEPSEHEESEIVRDEEDGFSSLIGYGNRQRDHRVTGWNCPVGANTR